MRSRKLFLFIAIIGTSIFNACNISPNEKGVADIRYAFTVSMERPGNHYFHIEMTCTDQQTDFIDFKMPNWTPGYYKIQNLTKNVVNFKAYDGNGNSLHFSKILKNTWRVQTERQETVMISYDVYADELSVVTSCLDVSKAFISPTSIFVFPDGHINEPVFVTLEPYGNWKNISTGLEPVPEKKHTYFASDFDVLFDCPILIGNHQVIDFTVKGVPHYLAVSAKDTLGKTRFISDLTKIVETATSLTGEIPYKHYTFITIGSYGGGLEHSNSTVLSCTGPVADTTDMEAYKDWLAFVAHEYFHLYNVKAIRPVALGPFNYDEECYTNMLWVSEGFTVYYEYLILNRAGILSREECLNYFSKNISAYENRPGHLFESATSSSFDAWIHFFNSAGDANNNTISYYDKGCGLGILLDLKIREASKNKKLLDDVMRTLYSEYYKKLKRGFTDEEFRSACEKIAGCGLGEIFEYVRTVSPIDYPKYFDIAGLAIDTTTHEMNDKAYLGAHIEEQYGQFVLQDVKRDSPAWNAGLGNGTQILEIEGKSVEKDLLVNVLKRKTADDTLKLLVNADNDQLMIPVILETEKQKTFTIKRKKELNDLQKEILDSWLK